MKFIKENIKALVLVLFVCISEVIMGLFSNFEHSTIDGYTYSYGDVLYYVFNQIGYISLLPSIFLYHSEKNIHSRGIYLGIVIWNILECLQEFNLLFKLNITFLFKGSSLVSDVMQIIFIILVVFLTYYAYKKWNTLSSP